eukprot:3497315-Rhodomonas_salina.1
MVLSRAASVSSDSPAIGSEKIPSSRTSDRGMERVGGKEGGKDGERRMGKGGKERENVRAVHQSGIR